MNFATDLAANRLPGSRVAPDVLRDKDSFLSLVAPGGISTATRAAIADRDGGQALAILMAAPEFQRR
jgi:hypothetical protein